MSGKGKPAAGLSEADRAGIYRAIFSRRDVRGQFLSDPIDEGQLARMLTAAHHAPSVGFMQPWNFILIESEERRRQVYELFEKANGEAAKMFDDERAQKYVKMKLEGILNAPLNLCITCNHDRVGPVVLGRTHIPETDLYSTVCAVQNLWLAARAEGVGVGWVSIFDPLALRDLLGLPEYVTPVAYLCLGYVSEFLDRPELEKAGWEKRVDMDGVLMFEEWGGEADAHPIAEEVRRIQTVFPAKSKE